MDENKLIEIYKEASKYFYTNQNNSNQKSKHWKKYNLREFTKDNLINFRNDGKLSGGLDDQNNTFTFNRKELLLKNIKNINFNNFKKFFQDTVNEQNKIKSIIRSN